MSSEYTQLTWEQTGEELVIKLPTEKGFINFPIDKRLINHLVSNSPKVVIFKIEITSQSEKEFLIDFEGIKSLISTANSLTKKTAVKDTITELEKTFTKLGKYCVARGESQFNKHISENGWQRQVKYFDIFDIQEVKFKTKLFNDKLEKEKAEIAEKTKQANAAKETDTKKSKLVQCVNCKEIIPNIPVCPYCGTKQS